MIDPMTHGKTSSSIADDSARESLRERCLNLVRRWQPLARSGWDHHAARQLGEELDQIAETSERLGLININGSALELAAYLCSFIDDALEPNGAALERLAAMVNVLGATLGELSGAPVAAVHALPTLPPAAPEGATASVLRLPRATCLFGDTVRAAPGLAEALRERGYQVNTFDDIEALLGFLAVAVPGALLLDARMLRHIGRIRARITESLPDADHTPALFVFSPGNDLGDRLLAMRAGAAGLFSAPVDGLRVLARVDEVLMHTTQTPWRVLLAETDRAAAAERARWLAERGMTVRLAANGQAALSALTDFRPDVLIVDQELSDVRGLELIQLVRAQPEQAALPIVLMSANGEIGERFDAVAAGCDDVLLKPVRARHLCHAVSSRLSRVRGLRELIGVAGTSDPRTGLHTRSVLIEKLAAAAGDRSAALMCITIDHAQALRERIGLIGLAALDAHVGQVLRSQLDVTDVAAHYQDFRYFVLMHRHSRSEVTMAAEDIRAAFARHAWTFGSEHALTASIGLTLLGGEQAGIDAIVGHAEAAQLAAEHMGGNRVLWYEAREAALLPTDPLLAVRAVVERPLKPEQAMFDFQPIVPLTGKLVGQFDLRFRVRSTQNPDATVAYEDLVPVAAETRQLAQVDRLLLQHTLTMREQQLKRGRQLRIFVPQSVESLMATDLAWWLERELKERHLSGTGLTLCLPCSPLIDAGSAARERMAHLRTLGLRICLNDFGRDWAAVHALKMLPVDVVRLDPALVQELGATRSTSDTVVALVRKAHAAGAAVVASEVDHVNRAHLLLRLGIDYAAGPAFSPPLTQPEFDFGRPLW
ncbi:MAG TPA: EAL domain-containing protein [Dokdonella sp.]|uniref:EAL domain-containing response regulator n=1 Tax=Dokdonella sp. TaxID=2291710 RepID=UPI0025C51BD8|nr:EAL domain-containing protein [Dokdonella sp.]MBX3691952.1 EAL domain-containing protein [Dokdonella sp.]HNR92429.1 EAL domain-containing protein [Dokdonella sp.]